MRENERITRAAGVVGAATLLSRILGFVRDVVIAYFFGSGMSADAFFVAFRIPNLLRRLFAEGALSVAFIPVFTEYLKQKSREEALRMARAVFTPLGLSLLLITALGIIFAPGVVWVIAPGFTDDIEKFQLTVNLTRICFPYIFFIGLVAICMGVLNSMRHFAAPALAPVLLNISMIGCVLVWVRWWENPIYALALGVFVGGVAQLALQVPYMKTRGFSFRPYFNFSHPALRKIILLMGPAALGSAVYQLNILVSTLLASLLPQGSVSYLYYADRLVQFPLGVFALALGTAALPSMSRHTAIGDMEGLVETFSHALRLVIFITLPAMVGLMILGHPIVEILFQRGAFGEFSTRMTTMALLYYSMGLWAFSSIRILVSAFYAMQDTKTPVQMASISFGANIIFCLILMVPLKHGGLALATSLSSILNLILLVIVLKKKLGRLDGRRILHSVIKIGCASLVMVLTLFALPASFEFGGKLLSLGVRITAGILVYTAASRVMHSEELNALVTAYLKKRKTSSQGHTPP